MHVHVCSVIPIMTHITSVSLLNNHRNIRRSCLWIFSIIVQPWIESDIVYSKLFCIFATNEQQKRGSREGFFKWNTWIECAYMKCDKGCFVFIHWHFSGTMKYLYLTFRIVRNWVAWNGIHNWILSMFSIPTASIRSISQAKHFAFAKQI